jgi:hypothetical protein
MRSRAGTGAALSQSAVAVAPRHDNGTRPIRDSADHLNRNHAGTASSTCVPLSCVCAVRDGDDLSSFNGDPGFARSTNGTEA